MLIPIYNKPFKKDIKLMEREHELSGNFKGYTECHIQGDWVLIYKFGEGVIRFARTGSHSDLF
ncbi:hypothetical protein FACS189483_10440 [Spirochaetia bacterium]|nr:hypothetical protein FACS189483_10440 [Spirochaetia bacterium]